MKEERSEEYLKSFGELLFAEYKHMADSFLENERLGERRVQFLVGLAGVVATVLGLLRGKDATAGQADPVLFGGLLALLAFGILTMVRVVKRNRETDRCLNALARIRQRFVAKDDETGLKFMPFDPYKLKVREREKVFTFGNGGLVETVGLVNSFLVAVLSALLAIWLVNAALPSWLWGVFSQATGRSQGAARFTFDWMRLAGTFWLNGFRAAAGIIAAVAGSITSWYLQMVYVRERYREWSKWDDDGSI